MQALYAYFKHSGESTVNKSEKELLFSINKAYDQYHYFMLLVIDIGDYAHTRIDIARNKKIPSEEDLNPNTKFVENKVIEQLRNNKQLQQYLSSTKLSWSNYPELIKGIYNFLIKSEDFKLYMSNKSRSYKEDKSFVCSLLKNLIPTYEPLFHALEEQSIYWNDEPEFILGIVIKTLKKFNEDEGENAELLPLYKNDEDADFSKKLLRKVILNHNQYLQIIEKFSKNWEVDRIAFLDILLMQMAIAEAIEFPSIPVKVTLNEYLEIAKYYSTAKSNIFLNGILDKAFVYLRENKQIRKQGRGLIGDT